MFKNKTDIKLYILVFVVSAIATIVVLSLLTKPSISNAVSGLAAGGIIVLFYRKDRKHFSAT